MGRPLFSTLIAPAPTPLPVRIADPELEQNKLPTYERWSYLNSFDPDSDEFFDGDVVYEAFLTPEEVLLERERELAQRERERQGEAGEGDTVPDVVRVPVSSQAQVRVRRRITDREQRRLVGAPVPSEDERPDLVSPVGDDSSSSGSETASSGRASPTEADELLDANRTRAGAINIPWDINDFASLVSTPPYSRSLPTTPTRASWLAESPVVFARPEELHLPMPAPPTSSAPVDIPAPATPVPHPAQVVPPSPMTPPGSVTPRFLTWGGGGSRPRAIDMSPSPTPAGPFGSARASRMSLTYISPPALRVQQ